MITRREHTHHPVIGEESGNRQQAATERLAEDHPIGSNRLVLTGQQLAGAAKAGLHFVDNEQHLMPPADRRASCQIAIRWQQDAALTLDRLDQEGGGMRRDGRGQRPGIAVGHGFQAGQEGTEAVAVLGFGRQADDGERAAMEIAGAGNDLGLALGHPLTL
jgi:hypothetical protein